MTPRVPLWMKSSVERLKGFYIWSSSVLRTLKTISPSPYLLNQNLPFDAMKDYGKKDIVATSPKEYDVFSIGITCVCSTPAEATILHNYGPITVSAPDKNREKICNFLRTIYEDVMIKSNDMEVDHDQLVIIAIHAVFLEFGFVCVDSLIEKMDGFRITDRRGKFSTSLHLRYNVPVGDQVMSQTVDLNFLPSECVYGSLGRKDQVDSLALFWNKIHFCIPSISHVCNFKGSNREFYILDRANTLHENNVYEFRKMVMDDLALPLLIDLCEETGRELPPCFRRLPNDLKLYILEFLLPSDIANIGCVSSELRKLSLNNDLWKHKYMEQFPVIVFLDYPKPDIIKNFSLLAATETPISNWKKKFVKSWKKLEQHLCCSRPHGGFWHSPYDPFKDQRSVKSGFDDEGFLRGLCYSEDDYDSDDDHDGDDFFVNFMGMSRPPCFHWNHANKDDTGPKSPPLPPRIRVVGTARKACRQWACHLDDIACLFCKMACFFRSC